MRYIATIILVVTTTFLAHSQTYEVGAMIGGANYIGDVGRTNYIAPNSLAFGGIFKWNRSPRHSFRASVLVFFKYRERSFARYGIYFLGV